LQQLQREFKRTRQSFGCRSERYTARLEALGRERELLLRDLSMLSLRPRQKVLMFGHSFLRELVVNVLIGTVLAHGRSSFVGGEALKWAGWEPPDAADAIRKGLFPGCVHGGGGQRSLGIGKRLDLDHEIKGHSVARLNFTGERSLTMVINYPPLQNPTCHRELDRFLELGSFDSVAFMTPHGDRFDQYLAMRAANKTAPPPVNLANIEENASETDSLARLFAGRSAFAVYVSPWGHERATRSCGQESRARGRKPLPCVPAQANHTMQLDDYTNHGGGQCFEPKCTSKGHGHGHQCNPGDLTFAARDLVQALAKGVHR